MAAMEMYHHYHPYSSQPANRHQCTLPSISNLIGLANAGSPTHEHPPAVPQARSSSRSEGNDHETTPPLEPDAHHHHRHHQSASTPTSAASGSYFPPSSTPWLACQGPLPPSLPPQTVAAPAVTAPIQTQQVPATATSSPTPPGAAAISRQPHHYLNPAPGHLFPQSQDRYICQTCNKAFSRPSGLRIHSHSHTGRKPFKCSQAGCGKAFSVRSNMKRHERGCHSVEVKGGAVLE